MNIFYVDLDPAKAAQALHNRHIIKMISESCQLLSVWASRWTPMDRGKLSFMTDEQHAAMMAEVEAADFDPEVTDAMAEVPPDVPWTGISHQNHPAALWLSEGLGNVRWLVEHLKAMVDEYDFRYPGNKDKFERARVIVPAMRYWLGKFVTLNHTCPKACFPDKYKHEPLDRENVMQGYRDYYLSEKIAGNEWGKREPPSWVIRYKELYKPPPPIDVGDIFAVPSKPKVEHALPVAEPTRQKVSAKDIVF